MSPQSEDGDPGSIYVQDPLPPLQLEVSPEEVSGPGGESSLNGDETFGLPLEDIRYRRLQAEVQALEDQLKERRQLHKLRKKHSSRLFKLSVAWIGLIWLVVLLQGFGQWFIPIPPWLQYIKFHLSDTVAVAFITSTTATVLGLYGIAAYWLFGKPKQESKDNSKDKKESN